MSTVLLWRSAPMARTNAMRQAQPRKQEQQVNNVTPTALTIEAATSNVDAVENGIHEEEDDSEIRNKGELVGYQDGSFVFGMLKKMNLNDSKLKSYNTFEQMDTTLKKGSQNGGVSAITFPKGSPLVLDFSRAVLQVTEEQMANISKQMFGEAASCIQQREPTVTSDRLSLDSFKGLFLIAGLSSTSALMIFIFKFLYNNGEILVSQGSSVSQKLAAIAKTFDRFESHNPIIREGEDYSKQSGGSVQVGSSSASAVVDLACMRDAAKSLGRDCNRINSLDVEINNLIALKGFKDASDGFKNLDRIIQKNRDQNFGLVPGLELKLSPKQKESIFINRMLLLLTLTDNFVCVTVAPLLIEHDVLLGSELVWSQKSQDILLLCVDLLKLCKQLSQEQINELAFGLEQSSQRFLWVIKSPHGKSNASYFNAQSHLEPFAFLRDGFLGIVKDWGFLVSSWAPQVEILGHGSIGGFLMHCGWNSILERVVRVDENGLVGRDEINKCVGSLITGEDGRKMKLKVNQLKELAATAMSQDSSSTKSLRG
ncbi:hydroquinone glucosyltransferase [Tanacetum coccineum]